MYAVKDQGLAIIANAYMIYLLMLKFSYEPSGGD
jgi:hypothetical protein